MRKITHSRWKPSYYFVGFHEVDVPDLELETFDRIHQLYLPEKTTEQLTDTDIRLLKELQKRHHLMAIEKYANTKMLQYTPEKYREFMLKVRAYLRYQLVKESKTLR